MTAGLSLPSLTCQLIYNHSGQANFHIELRADTPNEFRPVAFRGKRHAQKKQITPVCAAST
jgi:hypothetical protein